jgi:hypothetical protein
VTSRTIDMQPLPFWGFLTARDDQSKPGDEPAYHTYFGEVVHMKHTMRLGGKSWELHLVMLNTGTELVDKEGGHNRVPDVGWLTLPMAAGRRM